MEGMLPTILLCLVVHFKSYQVCLENCSTPSQFFFNKLKLFQSGCRGLQTSITPVKVYAKQFGPCQLKCAVSFCQIFFAMWWQTTNVSLKVGHVYVVLCTSIFFTPPFYSRFPYQWAHQWRGIQSKPLL